MSLIGAMLGINAAGNIINTAANYGMQKDQQAFNASQAQINRNWQEQMANTAYQRQIKDMEKAGINPAVAAGGSGANTPTGAAAGGQPGNAGFNSTGQLTSSILRNSAMKTVSENTGDLEKNLNSEVSNSAAAMREQTEKLVRRLKAEHKYKQKEYDNYIDDVNNPIDANDIEDLF